MCAVRFTCGEILIRLLAIGLSNGAVIALNAIGFTLVYGAVRAINLAHGDLFALTTVLVTSAVVGLGLQSGLGAAPLLGGLGITLALAMACGALLNVTVERVAFRPFGAGARMAPLIAGVGLSFALYQAALFWRTFEPSFIPGEHRSVPGVAELPRRPIPDLLPDLNLLHAVGLNLNAAYTLKDLLVLLVAGGLALLVGAFLQHTRYGRALRACAQDTELARLCGVDPIGAARLAFALGGALAGAAAFVFVIYYGHTFGNHGVQSGLVAFAAAALGGIGRPGGAFLSGLLFGLLSALSDYFLAAQWTPALVLAVLAVVFLLRPRGLANDSEDLAAQPPQNLHRAPRASWRWSGVALLALGLTYPWIDRAFDLQQQVVVTALLLFALLALGLNIALGLAGLLDLGFAAAFGIGAYTAALLTAPGATPGPPPDFALVLALSSIAAGAFGALRGALALRLRDDYLAIATLAFGQIVTRLFLNLDEWTGGAGGLSALPPPRLLGQTIVTPQGRYYLALALVALVAVASQRLARSRIGRAWAAAGEDEVAAASCGISPTRTRFLAFTLGAMIAGVAGALSASIFSYVAPDQSDFRVTAMLLAMVVIGGAGSVPGAIVGALLIAGYDQLAIPLLGAGVEQLAQATGSRIVAALDPRGLNYLAFGLALYFTVLLRSRRST